MRRLAGLSSRPSTGLRNRAARTQSSAGMPRRTRSASTPRRARAQRQVPGSGPDVSVSRQSDEREHCRSALANSSISPRFPHHLAEPSLRESCGRAAARRRLLRNRAVGLGAVLCESARLGPAYSADALSPLPRARPRPRALVDRSPPDGSVALAQPSPSERAFTGAPADLAMTFSARAERTRAARASDRAPDHAQRRYQQRRGRDVGWRRSPAAILALCQPPSKSGRDLVQRREPQDFLAPEMGRLSPRERDYPAEPCL